jgi:hypothetical protein
VKLTSGTVSALYAGASMFEAGKNNGIYRRGS